MTHTRASLLVGALLLLGGCPEPPVISGATPADTVPGGTTDLQSQVDTTSDLPDGGSPDDGQVDLQPDTRWAPECVVDSDCAAAPNLQPCESMACGWPGVCVVSNRLGSIGYGGALPDQWSAIVPLADGDVILAGTTASKGAGGQDAWIARASVNGTLRWETLVGTGGTELAAAAAGLGDGAVVAGAGDEGGWATAFDGGGSVRWQWTGGKAVSALVVRGTTVYALGWQDGEATVWSIDDASGSTTETWSFGTDSRINAISVFDNGVLLSGSQELPQGHVGWLGVMDDTGGVVWEQTFSETLRIDAAVAQGGGIVAAGHSGTGVFAMRTTADGTAVEWQRGYNLGGGDARVADLIASAEGGFILAGSTGGSGFLAHLAPSGALQWSISEGQEFNAVALLDAPTKVVGVGTGGDDALWHAIDIWGSTDCNPAGACYTLTPGDCPAGDACSSVTCDPASGCATSPRVCDDGSDCTVDTCDTGVGCTHTPDDSACDDGNPCTTDACDSTSGCTYISSDGSCEDGDLCTDQDTCLDGTCVGGPAKVCDDGQVCTDDACDASTGDCVASPNTGAPCDDGDACTGDDTCQDGACVGSSGTTCDDGNACTDDSCDTGTGTCVHTPTTGGACDDGSVCTQTDVCDAGTCVGGNPLVCADSDVCTDDTCDSIVGCVFAPNTGNSCDDGKSCTVDDACDAGACVGVTDGGACDDGNACTTDACDTNDQCTNDPVDCDDGVFCTADSCDTGTGCLNDPVVQEGVSCDDGDVCTPTSVCQTGSCVATSTCSDGDACTVDTCTATGCDNSVPVDCSDGNPCTVDQCDSLTGCANPLLDDDTPCDDGDDCTSVSACQAGTCLATDGCNDNDVCTDDVCVGGTCQFTPTSCDDGDLCTEDSCDPVNGCQHTAALDGTECDDANPCTSGETCTGGACMASQEWTGLQELLAPGLTWDSYFGESVAADGDWAVISEPYEGHGAVHVYRRTDTGWAHHARLTSSLSDTWGNLAEWVSLDIVALPGGGVIVAAGEPYGSYGDPLGFATGLGLTFEWDPTTQTWSEQIIASPDLALGEYFGVAVAVTDSWLAFGDSSAGYGQNGHGVVTLFERVDGAWSYWGTVEAPLPSDASGFGEYLDMDGTTLIVTASSDMTVSGTGDGALYVYDFDGSTWNFTARLTSDYDSDGYFGWHAAIDDGRIAVADAYASIPSNSQGQVYVFEEQGAGNWVLEAKLIASNGAQGDYFGQGIDIEGDTLCVGAARADGAFGSEDGAVYLFRRHNGIWVETDVWSSPHTDANLSMCAITGNDVVLGAPDSEANDALGAAFFVRMLGNCEDGDACTADVCDPVLGCIAPEPVICDDGDSCTADSCDPTTGCLFTVIGESQPCDDGIPCTTNAVCSSGTCVAPNAWSLEQKLVVPGSYRLGTAAALSGDWLAIGESETNPQHGRVHLYRRRNGQWQHDVTLTDGASETFDGFGGSLLAHPRTDGSVGFVVGAFQRDLAGTNNTGAAFYYTVNPNTGLWSRVPVENPTSEAEERFGYAMGLSDHTLVVSGFGSVEVYVWDTGTWSHRQTLTPSDAGATDFGYAVSIDGDVLVVSDPNFGSAGGTGAVYVFERNLGTWTETAKYYGDAGSGYFGENVLTAGGGIVVADPYHSETVSEDGALFFIERSVGVWGAATKALPPIAYEFSASLGYALVSDGERLYVGHEYANGSEGAILHYLRNKGTWSLVDTWLPDFDDSRLGTSLALSGATVVAGAPDEAVNAGAVYVYDLVGDCIDSNACTVNFCDLEQGCQAPSLVCDDDNPCTDDSCDTALGCQTTAVTPGLACDDGNPCTDGETCTANGGCLATQDPMETTQVLGTHPDTAGENFGYQLAADGDWLAVGEPFGGSVDEGLVHVYRRSADGQFQFHSTLSPSDAYTVTDYFGQDVAVQAIGTDGVAVTVGAYPTLGQHAYHYTLEPLSNTWTEELVLHPDTPVVNFGYAVASHGEWLVVGSYSEDSQDGAAYLYRRGESAWVASQRLQPPSAGKQGYFGSAVAVNGDLAAVAAPDEDNRAGNVYLYRLQGETWIHEATLTGDGLDGDFERFGNHLVLDGDRVGIGAWYNHAGGNNDAGSAYVFERSGGTWSKTQRFDGTEPFEYLGSCITFAAGDLYVGSYGVVKASVTRYQHDGSAWVADDTWEAPEDSAFSWDCVASGATLIVGASDAVAADGGSGAGRVYVVDLPETCEDGDPCTVDRCDLGDDCSHTPLDCDDGNTCTTDACDAGGCVHVAANDGVVCDDGLPCTTNDACVNGSCESAAAWLAPEPLLAPPPVKAGQFGGAVAVDGDWMAVAEMKAGATQGGVVHVYRRVNQTWTHVHELSSATTLADDDFGHGLALRDLGGGAVAIGVGAPKAYANGADGQAFYYEYDPAAASWSQQVLDNPEPDNGDLFGWSLAFDGDWLAVGATNDAVSPSCCEGRVHMFQRGANGAWGYDSVLRHPNPFFNEFGSAVAMHDGRLFIGAPGGGDDGYVWIFRLEGSSWLKEQVVAPSSDYDIEAFGYVLAVDGERLVVGARDWNLKRGRAYVFERTDGSGWELGQILEASDATQDMEFGKFVGVSGDTMCVGASGASGGGAVYRFDFVDGQWRERAKLQPAAAGASPMTGPCAVDGPFVVVGTPLHEDSGALPMGMVNVYELRGACDDGDDCTMDRCDPSSGCEAPAMACDDGDVCTDDVCIGGSCSTLPNSDYDLVDELSPETVTNDGNYGSSVTVHGDWLAVGQQGAGPGRVVLYQRGAGGWTFHSEIQPDDVTDIQSFGVATAMEDLGANGLQMVVGASGADTIANNAGTAFVFTYDTGTDAWVQSQQLDDPNATPNGSYGFGVALDPSGGGRLVVGRYVSGNGATAVGRAYVYTFGTSWTLATELTNTDKKPGLNDYFGSAVAIDGDTIVVGAFNYTTLSNRAGKAYVFEYTGGDWVETAVLDPGLKSARAAFGYQVAVDGDRLAIGATRLNSKGAVFLFDKVGGAWQQTALIEATDGAENDDFGSSVALQGDDLVIGAPHHSDRAGAAYRFTYMAGTWVEQQKLEPTVVADPNYVRMGAARATTITSDEIVVGAPREDNPGDDVGAVYVFGKCTP